MFHRLQFGELSHALVSQDFEDFKHATVARECDPGSESRMALISRAKDASLESQIQKNQTLINVNHTSWAQAFSCIAG